MKKFNMICAVSLNGVIGESETNTIPWHLPSDLKMFKETTVGKTVVMGSRTYKSLGRTLPNRRNVVITRNMVGERDKFLEEGVDETYSSFSEAFKYEKPGFFVIGGEHIYQEALRIGPDRLFLTIVKTQANGDVRFPVNGTALMNDYFVTNSNVRYVCDKRSDWMTENGLEFQFTEFTGRQPGAY